jgi:type I restriction enzyme, S subunit
VTGMGSELPAGWSSASIENLTVPKGVAYGVLKPGPDTPDGVPMLRVTDIHDGQIDQSAIYRISRQLDAEYSRTKLVGGEVLLSIQGTVGRAAIVPQSLAGANISRTLAMIRLADPTLARWVHRALESPQAQADMRRVVGGTTRDSLNLRDLRQVIIPLAPKSKRDAIIDLLNRTQSQIASTKTHIYTARRALERFRQAVLAAGCSGRLTSDWHEEYGSATASDILQRITDQRERILGSRHRPAVQPASNQLDAPEGWAVTSLDGISVRITSGSRDWSRYYGRGSGTFVMAQNVRRGYLDWAFRQAVDPPESDASRGRSQIEVGDLLVTIVGANTGDVGPVTDHRPEHYVCQSVALVRPVDARLTPFLNLWFNSPHHGRNYFEDCIYGAGRPHLSFDQLRAAPVAVPPLQEQEEIVRRVGKLLTLADNLSNRIDVASVRVQQSAQAVLAKAFRGELALTEAEQEAAEVTPG